MRQLLGKRIPAAVLAVVAVGLIAGGIAYASIPDATGVIHGCYNQNGAKSTGGSALNIIDSDKAVCSAGQQPISWNQAGQPGPTGPTGARGPSDAWDASTSSVSVPSNGASVVVVSLSLPAGSYFVETRAAIDGAGGYICSLTGPSGTLDSAETVADDFSVEPLQSTVTLASADSVSLKCSAVSNQATVSGRIDAIEIGTLH